MMLFFDRENGQKKKIPRVERFADIFDADTAPVLFSRSLTFAPGRLKNGSISVPRRDAFARSQVHSGSRGLTVGNSVKFFFHGQLPCSETGELSRLPEPFVANRFAVKVVENGSSGGWRKRIR